MSQADMERLIAAVESQLGGTWVDAIDWIRNSPANDVDSIAARIHAGDMAGAVAGVEASTARFAAAIVDGHATAAKAAATWLDKVKDSRLVTYDATNPRAAAWAEANRAELVIEVTQQQREVISQVVSRGVMAGVNPREVARDIRDSIGLTAHQEGHVASYRKALETGDFHNALGRELADGRSDRSLRAAMRDQAALPQTQIDAMVERYRTNYVNHRAEVIGRTEGLRAVHQGCDEMFQQAVENGDVEADELIQEWHIGGGPRTRDSHRAMAGQQRPIGEAFTTGAGYHLRYPGDPDAPASETIHCRCAVSTRARPSLPAGFSHTALSDGTELFDRMPDVYKGVPTFTEATKTPYRESVYTLKPSDLAEKRIYGIDTGGDDAGDARTQGIRDAWAAGAKLPALEVQVVKGGGYFVADGNHRLWAAIRESDKTIAVQFRPVDWGEKWGGSITGMDPIGARMRELLDE